MRDSPVSNVGEPYFTPLNSISGFFTFANENDSTASEFVLTSTVNGAGETPPQFTLAVFGSSVTANSFTWDNGEIVSWNFEISGEAFGGMGVDEGEFLSINNTGDNAIIDGGVSSASSSGAGVFFKAQAVPEPGSIALLSSVGVGFVLWRRKKKKQENVDSVCDQS